MSFEQGTADDHLAALYHAIDMLSECIERARLEDADLLQVTTASMRERRSAAIARADEEQAITLMQR